MLLQSKQKDRLHNKFLATRLEENNDCLVFQIDRVINTTKNGETNFFKRVEELKALVEKDGRNNDIGSTSNGPKFSDKQNDGIRPKNGRRPRLFFFIVITPIKKMI